MGIAERREREKEKRRNDIVDAAEKVFFTKGIENATMDEIAEEAELSKGTIYLYFKSKEELLFAIDLRAIKILMSLFNETVRADNPAIDNLIGIGRAYVRFSREYENYFKTLLHFEGNESGMFKAIIIAVIAIFAVLVLQFRSFIQPLIMFVSIPLAFIGSIWAWFLTGNTFSFTAFIGLISLVGIVINNAIILVDYTNILHKEGKTLEAAIQTACETRFTPIILTTLTTIGGLLPLTLGGGTLWAPMGWGIIGGLITSTFLTLLLVPVLYYLITKTHRRLVKFSIDK